MATIILRLGKGSPLTNSELDSNFTNLNTELGTKASTSSLASVAFTGSYSSLAGTPTLGTAAAKDIPATGNASATQVVYGTDTRLSDARTPTAHNQAWSTINNTPTTLAGYGITDAYNSSNPAGYISGITSANVTTALGFTPYNSTNPNGYITTAGARAAISVTGSGSYDSATGIITVTGGVTSVNSRTGAVTITSADVTGALGFTPYNATNPTGYITSSALSGYLTSSTAASTYLPLSGGTVTGSLYLSGYVQFPFANTDADQWPNVRFGAADAANGWDEGIIKAGSGNGVFGRYGMGIHTNSNRAFGIYSSGWNKIIGFKSDEVRSYVALTQNGNQVLHAGNYNSYAVAGAGFSTNQNLGTSNQVTFDSVITGNNGNGTNFRLGDDAWIGDVNLANTTRLQGVQSAASGYLIFGNGDNTALGRAGTGALTYGGNNVLTAANYNSYAPTLTGTGATGTWAINITGSAATATSASNSNTVGGLAPAQFFNNMGNNHSTYTDFNNVPGFGAYYVQQGGNSPTGVAANQWYGFTLGLGNEYALSSYGTQLYWPRRAQNGDTYIYVRDREGGSWTSWTKIKAGYADSAGSATDSSKLPLTGGTISGAVRINSQLAVGQNTNGTAIIDAYGGYAWFGRDSNSTGIRIDASGNVNVTGALTQGGNQVLHAGNYSSYALPLSGGTLSGTLTIGSRLSLFDDGNVHIHATSGPMWLNASDGSTINLNGQTSGFTYLANSARSPIFYDYNDTGYYVDANNGTRLNSLTINDGNVQLYKSQTVDLSNTGVYSTSNYYPVVIGVPADGVWIEIQNNLNSNVPSWATHGAGFTLNLRWFTTGSGWGTTEIKRRVEQYHERFTNATICGGITQLSQSSSEIVWLRGGGTYYFKYSKNLSATPYSSTYSANGQSASPTSSAQNSVWNSAAGAHVSYNTDVYADSRMDSPIFYDRNDTGYYANLNDNSYLNTLNVAFTNFRVHMDVYGPIYSYKNDLGYILQTFNQSAGNPGQFNIRHDYGNVIMENTRGNTYVYGNAVITNNSLRAPIFYDSDNTGYYCDPTGTSVLNTISAQGNVFTAGYVQTNASGVKWDQSGVRSWSMYPSGGDMYLTSGDTSGSFYVTLTGGVRSPIFYDSNDTAYFIDPNSSHSIRVAGQITASNYMVGGLRNGALNIGRTDTNYDWGTSTAWGSYTSVGILANCSDNWEMAIHDSGERVVSPFAFFGGGSNYILMGRDIGWGTTYIQAANSFRAPIFYDSNDTGYYTDPNGTSYLNVVGAAGRFYTGYDSSQPNSFSCSNWFRSSGNTGWYNASYGVGIYAVDSTWVRTYNSAQFYSDTIIQAGASVRAPIFYDSGDTSFYCDPNGTSRLSTIRTTEHMFINHSNPTIHFVDSDERGAALHNNSNLFYILSSNGTGGESWTQNNGYWPFYINLNSNDATFGGAIWAAGNITAYSDIKLKENIQTIDSALEKVLKLRGVYYTLKRDETKTRKVGVIAQEMQEVLPEVVVLHKDVEDTEGTLAVDYGNISGLLIEAIKEQNQEIVDLRNRVAQLESLIHKLIGEQP